MDDQEIVRRMTAEDRRLYYELKQQIEYADRIQYVYKIKLNSF